MPWRTWRRSLQEPEQPERNPVAEPDLHIVVHDIAVWDVRDLRKTFAIPPISKRNRPSTRKSPCAGYETSCLADTWFRKNVSRSVPTLAAECKVRIRFVLSSIFNVLKH